MKKPPRPCPTCKAFPGIDCAACLGRGHSPKATRLIVPEGFSGRFIWPGVRDGGQDARASIPIRSHNIAGGQLDGGHPVRVRRPLGETERDFLSAGGWHVADHKNSEERGRGGLTGHVGILHPDEWVDEVELRRQAEESLGFTLDEFARLGNGRPRGEDADLSRAINVRLAELVDDLTRGDGGVTKLAEILGVSRRALSKRVARGRQARKGSSQTR